MNGEKQFQALHAKMKMSDVLRSAARELCKYIDGANHLIQDQHVDTMQPPDFHDHQTCHELDLIANTHDKLVEALEALLNRVSNDAESKDWFKLEQMNAQEALKQAKDNQE